MGDDDFRSCRGFAHLRLISQRFLFIARCADFQVVSLGTRKNTTDLVLARDPSLLTLGQKVLINQYA